LQGKNQGRFLKTTTGTMEQNYQNLSLPELCELLIQRTEKLLAAFENSPDGLALRDLKMEVEEIREEIQKRRKLKEQL
jgi:hypothetical protein